MGTRPLQAGLAGGEEEETGLPAGGAAEHTLGA